jgi:hypothetical protein
MDVNSFITLGPCAGYKLLRLLFVIFAKKERAIFSRVRFFLVF